MGCFTFSGIVRFNLTVISAGWCSPAKVSSHELDAVASILPAPSLDASLDPLQLLDRGQLGDLPFTYPDCLLHLRHVSRNAKICFAQCLTRTWSADLPTGSIAPGHYCLYAEYLSSEQLVGWAVNLLDASMAKGQITAKPIPIEIR